MPLTRADCCAHRKHTSVGLSSCRARITPSSSLTSRGIGPPSTPWIATPDVGASGDPRKNGRSEAITKATVPRRNMRGALRENNDELAWIAGAEAAGTCSDGADFSVSSDAVSKVLSSL